MRNLRTKPRLMQAKQLSREQLNLEHKKLKARVRSLNEAYDRHVDALKTKPAEFVRQILGCELFDYEKVFVQLFQDNQFLAARWCRQSGKSWTVSALLLNYALNHPDSYIGVVGPSWRQTKLNIRRISYFLRRIPPEKYLKPGRTVLRFTNGSVIEAFPNNPDTIRGPTLAAIWWDEANFTPCDQDLYDAILFTLGTTNGKLVVTSTPWNTDSLFWKMCNHKDYDDFARHHVTWQQAQEPNGPLKKGILDKIRKQFAEDPSRWRREMEAEWAEDEDVWLPQSLIVACVGTGKNCGEDLQPWNPEQGNEGDLFAGLDLAQVRDYCVFSVIQRLNNRLFLRHLKIFSQPTKYSHVLGYVKMLQDRWGGFSKMRVDFTKEGPSIISDMTDAGIKNAEGVTFSLPRKSEMANLMKQRMGDQNFFYPLLTWEKPYRGDICTELNVERYELRKDGAIALTHPSGTHDDVFWSIALAIFATVEMKVVDLEALRFG
jgi:phage FluMu gp28-like protein